MRLCVTPAVLPRIARALLIWSLLLGQGGPVLARHILDLDADHQPAQLLDWGDYLISSGRDGATLPQVLAQASAFRPTLPQSGYALHAGQVLWIKFAVPAAPDDQRWYLRLPRPGLDLATLYTLGRDDNWTPQSAGDTLPMSSWAVPHLYPVLPLNISAADPTYYVLRVQSSDGFDAPIEFVNESRLSWEQQRTSLFFGVYFGLLGMGAIFALATSVALRDSAYLWFALWSSAAALAAATAVGVAGLHLWPQSPAWSDAAHCVLPPLAASAFLLFVAEALLVRERAARLFWFACAIAAVGVLGALLAGAAAAPQRMFVSTAAVAVCVGFGVGLGAWSWYRGDRFAGKLLVAFSPMLLALPVQLASVMHWPGIGSLPIILLLAALALTGTACYLLLALRSQEKRDHRRRIAQLHEVDPTTGLANDTVYLRRLAELIERAERFSHHSVAAIVDFTNLAELRSEFGRQRSVELLVRLGDRLTQTLRSMDTVARLGEFRFGLLIEGPVPPSRSKSFCAKVIAHCITPFAGLPQGMVVRPRIALALVPAHGSRAQSVVDELEGMLKEASGDPARLILIAHTSATDASQLPSLSSMPASAASAHASTDRSASGFAATTTEKEHPGA
jgi:two-component system, sensor histidine kinase LadS